MKIRSLALEAAFAVAAATAGAGILITLSSRKHLLALVRKIKSRLQSEFQSLPQ
jgi:hypothetical protein